MLIIKVVRYKDASIDQPIVAEFREEGGTIGRSPESTLLLPDPDRVISRTHAVIARQAGRFVVRDQGTTVPVVVNGRPVGKGRDHPLAAGDEMRIAAYTMQIDTVQEISADETTTILREGTLLSWSEDGKPVAENRISTYIVPEPAQSAPLPAPAAASETPDAVVPTMLTRAPQYASAPAGSDPMLSALLRGAGVSELSVPGGLTPQFMEDVGAVMRETMRGLLDLLAARAHAKREVRADATIIVANDNNPLKFSPDLDAAVAHLLMPRGQGFMAPQRSIVDARESLRSHQEGFVAGMQAALAAVLARFDPGKLEERLLESAPGGSLLPMTHKAKLWNLYEALYGEISREAESDFHFLFGEEFLAAYQAKTRPPARDPAPDTTST